MPDNDSPPATQPASVEDALGRMFRGQVLQLGNQGEFHNRHFRAVASWGEPVFVKVFDDASYWARAIAAATPVELLLRTPRMLDHGRLGPERWWISYQWVDLEPFAPTARRSRRHSQRPAD